MIRLLIAGLVWLAAAGEARADPGSLFAIGTFLATPLLQVGTYTLLTVGQLVLTVAAAAASFALSSVLAPTGTADPGRARGVFAAEQQPVFSAFGRARVGGAQAFGNTADAVRWRWLWHSVTPLVQAEHHWLGGREVILDANGKVETAPYVKSGGSWITIINRPGSPDQLAPAELVAAWPGAITADHRGRGNANSTIAYEIPSLTGSRYLELYGTGYPEYEVEGRWGEFYDPRTGLTGWSENGIVIALWAYTGLGEYGLDQFDLADLAAQATLADALLPAHGGGTEARARAWGVYADDMARGDFRAQLLASIGADRVTLPSGLWSIRLRTENPVPTAHIPGKHIREETEKAGADSARRKNICRIEYYAPQKNYKMTEIDMTGIGWARVDSEITLVGEQIETLRYPFCPGSSQAQRNAYLDFALERGDRVSIVTDLYGLVAWGQRCITVELETGTKRLWIDPVEVDDERGEVTITGAVLDTLAPYDPALHEAAPPEPEPAAEFAADVETPAQPGVPVRVVTLSGAAVMRFGFALPSGADTAEATYRVITGGLPGAWVSMTEDITGTVHASASATAVLLGTTVQVRVRGFDSEGRGSNWSPLREAVLATITTAPAVPAISVAPSPGGATVTVTAPADLHLAGLELAGTGLPATVDAAPGDVLTWPLTLGAGSYTFTARALAPGGAASSTVSASITI